MKNNITIRQSVRKELADTIPGIVEAGLNWMQSKYPDVNFSNAEFIFSAGYNRSRYFRNEVANAKYIAPNVCISTRATLYLYNKPSLGIKKNKVFTGAAVQMMCAIIHELTHHAQYETNIRKGNELDTTQNELQYLKENHINYYNKLVIPSLRIN